MVPSIVELPLNSISRFFSEILTSPKWSPVPNKTTGRARAKEIFHIRIFFFLSGEVVVFVLETTQEFLIVRVLTTCICTVSMKILGGITSDFLLPKQVADVDKMRAVSRASAPADKIPDLYVSFPLALATAIALEPGEEGQWEMLDRGELHLVRPKRERPERSLCCTQERSFLSVRRHQCCRTALG